MTTEQRTDEASKETEQGVPPPEDGTPRQEAPKRSTAETIATLGPLIALVIICVFFSLTTDRFFSGSNLSLVVQQVMVIGALAIGQTLIILTAGIDLSCGAVMALGNIVMTKLAVDSGIPPFLAILLGIATCMLIGFVNGAFVTGLKLPPFIVTLGTLNIAFALTHIYSQDETVSNLPGALTALGNSFQFAGTAITYGSVLTLLMFAAAWFVLTQTAWGRRVYALGDNPEATRLMGIPVNRMLLGVYTGAGAIYGIAALLLVSRTSVGDPNAGVTENLESITAVVLGGTSLFGGRGTIIGTLIGALIVGVLRNGLVLLGVPSIYQVLITGILVITAVSVDQLARSRS